MSPSSQALLLTMMDAPRGCDAEFNDWANLEHIPERKGIAGFATALRFENELSSPRYLAIYDLDDISVLKSPAYLAISGSNLSAWSKRILAGASAHWRFAGSRIAALPDDGPTGAKGPPSELLLIVWRGASERCDDAIAAILQTLVARLAGVVQVRGFVGESNGGFDYVAIAESTQAFSTDIIRPERYAVASLACDLVRVFSPVPAHRDMNALPDTTVNAQ
ncbi:hypothetical protein [Paraburkholderia sp. 35.1]|uniref:hypothetical protein n=1 Tax=Paraburkholderia sp. 35.1 TaxID=2991058 RepID=UPI003D1EE951